MAKNNDIDVLDRFASAGNDAVGLINRVDDATRKFQPGQRRGSIIKAAQGNVFEFPVFISSSIPMDYATATASLLEQIYAAYLQMAISINPVIDAASVKNGLQFANYKTDTNKYLEYTDTTYQHDACHAIYQEDGVQYEFNMLSIEDREARLINEAVDHQPLSEFEHFFQEARVSDTDLTDQLYPYPLITVTGGRSYVSTDDERDNNGNVRYQYYLIDTSRGWGTLDEIEDYMIHRHGIGVYDTHSYLSMIPDTMRHYGLDSVNAYDVDRATNESDRNEMVAARNACSNMNPQQLANNTALLNRINDLDSRYPGFADEMRRLTANVQRANTLADREDEIHRINYGTRTPNGYGRPISAEDDVDNSRAINARKAQIANSRYYRANDAINTGVQTVDNVAKAVGNTASAIYNVGTLKDRMQQEKLKTQQLRDNIAHSDEDRAIKKSEVYSKLKNKVEYVDDNKCQKLNTMKPLLMSVTINMLNKDDSLQPINYIIGVKTHSRVVPASVLPEVARYPLKEMDKISRKVKWRAGELKFLKDLVFRINEKKQTAADSRDPNRKWYRRLYELAHMKGDAPAAAVVQGKSLFGAFIRDKQGKGKMMHGMIPNASIIMSQADVDNIKNQTEINLLKASAARAFCGELFLMSLVIIDTDAESIKVMLPDMNNDFDVHSLASVNKQLATLDTSGTKTRDMFKLLG